MFDKWLQPEDSHDKSPNKPQSNFLVYTILVSSKKDTEYSLHVSFQWSVRMPHEFEKIPAFSVANTEMLYNNIQC